MYRVLDIKTGVVMGTYVNRNAAYALADRLDARYGAVRYVVKSPDAGPGPKTWSSAVLQAGPL